MSELVDLFNRDPLSLTKDDEAIKQAIEAYRGMRAKFNLGDTRAGTVKPKAPKANPTLATLLEGGMELKI